MPIRTPSPTVLAQRAARGQRAAERNVRIEWFTNSVLKRVGATMRQRITLATEHVQNKVVQNISRPTTKGTGPRGGRVVLDRSKPGEFPKQDTSNLLRNIFTDVRKRGDVWDGFIGTPLDYGLFLEQRMDREFLSRTLREERTRITLILTTGPIR